MLGPVAVRKGEEEGEKGGGARVVLFFFKTAAEEFGIVPQRQMIPSIKSSQSPKAAHQTRVTPLSARCADSRTLPLSLALHSRTYLPLLPLPTNPKKEMKRPTLSFFLSFFLSLSFPVGGGERALAPEAAAASETEVAAATTT